MKLVFKVTSASKVTSVPTVPSTGYYPVGPVVPVGSYAPIGQIAPVAPISSAPPLSGPPPFGAHPTHGHTPPMGIFPPPTTPVYPSYPQPPHNHGRMSGPSSQVVSSSGNGFFGSVTAAQANENKVRGMVIGVIARYPELSILKISANASDSSLVEVDIHKPYFSNVIEANLINEFNNELRNNAEISLVSVAEDYVNNNTHGRG